jgi:hypothetical protein
MIWPTAKAEEIRCAPAARYSHLRIEVEVELPRVVDGADDD